MCEWKNPHPNWHHGGPPPWVNRLPHKRRFLFFRFAAFFGTLLLVFLGVFGVLLWLALGRHSGAPLAGWPLLVACAVPLVFTMLTGFVFSMTFRRFGSPVAEVMAAADAVAGGDLEVRVRENIPGEFGRLARSFNRMTAELARADHQRRNLTADVAHELRTPLHIIQGNLEGILDGVYQPTPEHITATLDETRLLARLVADLQTLSLAESGQLPLHPTTLSAAELLNDAAASFAGQASDAEVTITVAPLADPGLTLRADPDRIDQVLSNLIANALHHTPPGGQVTLRAEPLPSGARLVVEDTGTGIAPEDLPYVFDRFWRGDRARTRREGSGSGLGLAIARQLVQSHGGTIQVESQPGAGTKFTVEIPEEVHSRQ